MGGEIPFEDRRRAGVQLASRSADLSLEHALVLRLAGGEWLCAEVAPHVGAESDVLVVHMVARLRGKPLISRINWWQLTFRRAQWALMIELERT